MEERIYKLYMHTNVVNNKKYIGITRQKINARWQNGNGYKNNKYFHRAIQKYGWDNFRHEVILCNLTKKEAEMFEIEMIKYNKSNDRKFGYNIDSGGNSNGKISEETRKKLSKNHRDISGKNNPLYGKPHPLYNNGKKIICLETKEIFNSVCGAVRKIKNIKKANIISNLKNRCKSVGGLHFKYLEDYIEGKEYDLSVGNNKHRKIRCIDTNEIFDSVKDVATSINMSCSNIFSACNGIHKTCGGLHFEYYYGGNIL